MGLYQDHIMPYLVNLAMRTRQLAPYRERIIRLAEGRVLEIDVSSGWDLPLYNNVRKWQNGLTPAWKRLAGVCHLNRADLIAHSGCRIPNWAGTTGYSPGPKPMTFTYMKALLARLEIAAYCHMRVAAPLQPRRIGPPRGAKETDMKRFNCPFWFAVEAVPGILVTKLPRAVI